MLTHLQCSANERPTPAISSCAAHLRIALDANYEGRQTQLPVKSSVEKRALFSPGISTAALHLGKNTASLQSVPPVPKSHPGSSLRRLPTKLNVHPGIESSFCILSQHAFSRHTEALRILRTPSTHSAAGHREKSYCRRRLFSKQTDDQTPRLGEKRYELSQQRACFLLRAQSSCRSSSIAPLRNQNHTFGTLRTPYVSKDVSLPGKADPTRRNCFQVTVLSSSENRSSLISTCSANATVVSRAQEFLAELLQWCERSPTNVKESALFINISLGVD